MIPPPPRSTLFPYTTLFRSKLDVIENLVASLIRQRVQLTVDSLAQMLVHARNLREKRVQSLSVRGLRVANTQPLRSEEHTSELQSQSNLVCRLLLEKKNNKQ